MISLRFERKDSRLQRGREEIPLNRCRTKKSRNSFRPLASFQFSGAESPFNLVASTASEGNASSSRFVFNLYESLSSTRQEAAGLILPPATSLPIHPSPPHVRILAILQSRRRGRGRGASSWERETRHKTTPTPGVVGYRRYIIAPSGKVAFSRRKCRGSAIVPQVPLSKVSCRVNVKPPGSTLSSSKYPVLQVSRKNIAMRLHIPSKGGNAERHCETRLFIQSNRIKDEGKSN